ncbi:FAD-dependent oxidoreductase (plasmid) [Caballeronia sp. NK8]|uniref:NAD(P)/FAD-dependent oxidoreductase n=1 Tax=Caballeronia sp. NK8 TaxID=140098 RepID=UPI001BB5E1E5|nr:FAD-dependent oxidoreductase [Caballeronia sp. NK8]BCQ30250.1 FAD-dependent oxidoreductase [Caballeronia sp. NK8]
MSETTETQAEQQADSRSAVNRRTFLKGAAAAAVVAPAVAATQCSSNESGSPVEEARMASDMEKYRALGVWVERPDDLQPELVGDVNADVVIIGAGFAGLSRRLNSSSTGANVVVLEREFAGFGASGRNAGYLAGALGLEYDLFLKNIGNEKGKEIVRYYEDAVPFVEGKLKEYEIDCDYNQTGIIRAGIDPSQEDKVRESMRTGAELGCQSEFLDQAEMRARGIPPAFLFGNYVSRGGTLHPGKYVMGLRRAALRAGVRIFENTPLLSYTEGSVIKVQTPRGSASAPAMMLATNAYTPQLGLLADKVVPLRVSAIETRPLLRASAQGLRLATTRRDRDGTLDHGKPSLDREQHARGHDEANPLSVRLQTPNVPDYESYRELRTALHDRFPSLKGVALRACWSGYISLANDALPVVGTIGSHQNIFYSAGCSGHGVASQSMVGSMIAGRIRGTDNPLLSALDHKTPSMLPEPLRWCVMTGALGVVNALDERVNSKVRAAQARMS